MMLLPVLTCVRHSDPKPSSFYARWVLATVQPLHPRSYEAKPGHVIRSEGTLRGMVGNVQTLLGMYMSIGMESVSKDFATITGVFL